MLKYIKDQANRNAIISGVIASLIVVIFIQPFLGYVWQFLIWLSSITYSGLLDPIYKNAALGTRNWVVAILAIFFLVTPMLALFLRYPRQKINTASKINKKLKKV